MNFVCPELVQLFDQEPCCYEPPYERCFIFYRGNKIFYYDGFFHRTCPRCHEFTSDIAALSIYQNIDYEIFKQISEYCVRCLFDYVIKYECIIWNLWNLNSNNVHYNWIQLLPEEVLVDILLFISKVFVNVKTLF